jgi:hypothetical protein
MNYELTDVQFQILDSVYFVESFAHIVEEAMEPPAVVKDEIRTLIDRGYVQVMIFDQEKGDYYRTTIYDADNIQDYSFLATKDGLLKHNGF